MQNKVSINATDIIDYRERAREKSYSFDFEHKNASIQNSGENERKYSEVKAGKSPNQYSFLSRIRVSGGKDRYKNQRQTSNADKRYNSMQVSSENKSYNNEGKCETLEAVQNTRNQINNYSPFSEKPLHYKICQIGQADLGLSKKIKQKLCLDHLRGKQFIKHSPGPNKIRNQGKATLAEQKFFAKMFQFTTEFDKKKLFEQDQDQLKLKIKQQQKLSPYQLSIRRKNLNLIKMKLNSLGQKADDQQKHACFELSRLCNQTESKKLKQRSLKRKQQEKLAFGNKKQMWPKKYAAKIGSSKQWGEWSGQTKQKDTKFDLNTKTITLKQIPHHKKRSQQYQSLSYDKNQKKLKPRKNYQQPLIIF